MILKRCLPRGALSLGLALLLTGVTACASDTASPDASSTTAPGTASSTTTMGKVSSSSSSSTSSSTPLSSTSTVGGPLEGAATSPRSAPADGTGTALLTDVRVGINEGFERIVFEFKGTSHPGYRVRWVDGPILGDASGEPVAVDGNAYLEMIMEPASGIDMDDGSVTYDGADRIPVAGRTAEVTDLVRTGDFEAVLTWVAGATARVPFRVLSLNSPTRLVIDLSTT